MTLYVDGVIAADEVWLFDRALTAGEVSALAEQNTPGAAALVHLPLELVCPE